MEIKTIRKDRLQNMEHFQFAGHVLAMCKTANVEKLNPLLAPLEAAIAKEDEALNLPQKMEGTCERRQPRLRVQGRWRVRVSHAIAPYWCRPRNKHVII